MKNTNLLNSQKASLSRPLFGVSFNKSPLDDMKFKNGGMSFNEAVKILGGVIPPCNEELLSVEWGVC